MKYHVFIGSTLDDLKNERRELPRIIMELGHIPVMADYLGAKPDSAHVSPLLQRLIEESDYFIALSAHKYSAPGAKASPLEAEYSVAIKRGIPVLALVLDEKARWKASKKETEAALIKKQEKLRKMLQGELHETWINTADLCQKAQGLLVQAMNLYPQTGWVKANQAISPTVANELARLSSANEQLRRQVKVEDGVTSAKLQEQTGHDLKMLALNTLTLSFYYSGGENWENTRQFRSLKIFELLSPELALGKTTAEISRFLGTVLNPDLDRTVRKDYPTPSNTIKKIMADYSLLKLVICTNEAEENAGDEVWEITEYGKELYTAYRMRQLEKAVEKKPE
jgi:hypothetical protein